MTTSAAFRSQIEGAFTGFNADALFHLADGTYWLLDEYKYWYHYEYRPHIEIIVEHRRCYLRVAGRQEAVSVRQIYGVISSQISDAFEGWQGESEYELTNGQVWRQSRYRYQYSYSYRPRALIYDTPAGKVMDVAGCRALVKRVR